MLKGLFQRKFGIEQSISWMSLKTKSSLKKELCLGTEGKPETGSNYFWIERLVEDENKPLDKMYELATSPRFKEIEEEVKNEEELTNMLIEIMVKK